MSKSNLTQKQVFIIGLVLEKVLEFSKDYLQVQAKETINFSFIFYFILILGQLPSSPI